MTHNLQNYDSQGATDARSAPCSPLAIARFLFDVQGDTSLP